MIKIKLNKKNNSYWKTVERKNKYPRYVDIFIPDDSFRNIYINYRKAVIEDKSENNIKKDII